MVVLSFDLTIVVVLYVFTIEHAVGDFGICLKRSVLVVAFRDALFHCSFNVELNPINSKGTMRLVAAAND